MTTLDDIRKRYAGQGKGEHSPEMRRELAAVVRALLAAGQSDYDICADYNLTSQELADLKRHMYSHELLQVAHRDPAEVFIDYKLRMEGVCDDLDEVHTGAKSARQFTAAMGALKAKAMIIDKVIDRGQEMGVIQRAARRHEVIGGVIAATLSDGELLKKMRELSKDSTRLLKEYGDTALTDLDISTIYQPVAVRSE